MIYPFITPYKPSVPLTIFTALKVRDTVSALTHAARLSGAAIALIALGILGNKYFVETEEDTTSKRFFNVLVALGIGLNVYSIYRISHISKSIQSTFANQIANMISR